MVCSGYCFACITNMALLLNLLKTFRSLPIYSGVQLHMKSSQCEFSLFGFQTDRGGKLEKDRNSFFFLFFGVFFVQTSE